MGISIARSLTDSVYIPFRHINGESYNLHWWKGILQSQILTKPIIFHNAKFDLVSLETLGLDCSNVKFYDTMLMAHLLNEEFYSKSLDALSRDILQNDGKKADKDFKDFIKLLGWEEVPSEMMAEYAATDAALTYGLYEAFKPKMIEEKLGDTWKHKQNFVKLIIKMEKEGVLIDRGLCGRQVSKGQDRMGEIISELGGRNPASPIELGELLLNELSLPIIRRTATGKPSFDKSAMAEYDVLLERINHPVAGLIEEYRGWQKSVSSNYQAYLELLSPDGRLRPNYKLHGTVTGRMSCEKPNLQQIPRGGDKAWNGQMKKAFIAKPGYTLLEVDYSQLEMRLGTAYAGDEKLKDVFATGRDLFTEMAKQLGMTRQDTKTLVYSMQYGAGVDKIATVFAVTNRRAREIRDNYYKTYPAFKTVIAKAEREVVRNGKVQLWSGRYRHMGNAQSQGYKAFNSVIQGGAADVVERTMVRLDQEGFNTEDCKMLLQVHDSVVFEAKEDKLDYFKDGIVDCFIRIPTEHFGVKFDAEAKIWGEK